MPWPNKERWSRRRGDFLRLKKRFKSSPFGPLSSSGLLHFHITSTFLSNFSLIFLTILRNSSQFFPICFLSFFFFYKPPHFFSSFLFLFYISTFLLHFLISLLFLGFFLFVSSILHFLYSSSSSIFLLLPAFDKIFPCFPSLPLPSNFSTFWALNGAFCVTQSKPPKPNH